MKRLVYISLVVLLLCGCGTSKKYMSEVSHVSEQTTDSSSRTSNKADTFLHESEKIDTAIGIAGVEIRQVLSGSDLKPVTNSEGKKQGQTHTQRSGNLESTVSVDSNGNVTVNCKSDSLTRIIRGLLRERTYLSHYSDSVSKASQFRKKDSVYVYITKTVTVRSWWASNWWMIVLGVIGCAIVVALRYFRVI